MYGGKFGQDLLPRAVAMQELEAQFLAPVDLVAWRLVGLLEVAVDVAWKAVDHARCEDVFGIDI